MIEWAYRLQSCLLSANVRKTARNADGHSAHYPRRRWISWCHTQLWMHTLLLKIEAWETMSLKTLIAVQHHPIVCYYLLPSACFCLATKECCPAIMKKKNPTNEIDFKVLPSCEDPWCHFYLWFDHWLAGDFNKGCWFCKKRYWCLCSVNLEHTPQKQRV
jgi:hypothetical protein